MIGLDTNVLVRYLTQDEPKQAEQAGAIVEGAAERQEPLLVSCIVLSELVWVLRGAYKVAPAEILDAVEQLLDTPQLELEDRDVVRRAVADARTGLGDLVDSLIGRRNEAQGCSHTATFDRGLGGHPAFALV